MQFMFTGMTQADVYSSPRIEVLEVIPCESLLQGSQPLEGGAPGDDLLPGGDFTM